MLSFLYGSKIGKLEKEKESVGEVSGVNLQDHTLRCSLCGHGKAGAAGGADGSCVMEMAKQSTAKVRIFGHKQHLGTRIPDCSPCKTCLARQRIARTWHLTSRKLIPHRRTPTECAHMDAHNHGSVSALLNASS